jgi:hypothetical protein
MRKQIDGEMGSAFSRGKYLLNWNLFDWLKKGRKRCRRDFVYLHG